MNEFGISENIMAEMLRVFKSNKKIEQAVLFGSRAKNNFSAQSDVDVALIGNLTCLETEEIVCLLDDLPSALTFDVLAYGAIKNPLLCAHINRVGKVVYERGKEIN